MERRPPTTDKPKFPPAAISAFREMHRLEQLSPDEWPPDDPLHQAWIEQHHIVHRELHLQPWEFYGVMPPSAPDMDERSGAAKERYRALAEAAAQCEEE